MMKDYSLKRQLLTITNNHTTDGTGTGNFTSNITGLTVNTTYYIRAYASNSVGIAYGNQITFTPLSVTCPITVTDTRDNKIYNVINIGYQCWMKENLNYIPVSGSSWCYNNDANNCNTYGRLYNWSTAMNGAASSTANPSAVKGACPTGWHIPSNAEWTQLTDYLGGASVAGGKMKEVGTVHWQSPNTGADNTSEFLALPGGWRGSDGVYDYLGKFGDWWSTSESGSYSVIVRELDYSSTSAVTGNGFPKSLGISIRCLRD